jgi:hypothetical protein
LHAHDVPTVLQGSYGGYAGWFMGGLHDGGLPFLMATVRTNVHTVGVGIATSFLYQPGRVMASITTLALLVLFGYGAWRVRRRAPVTLVFLVLYIGLVLAWPDQPLRFVWGLWPVLMVLLLVPMEVLQQRESPRPARVGVAIAGLLLLPGMLRYNGRGFSGKWWENIPRSMTDRAQTSIRWVRMHTHPTDVVASESDPMIYLYAERHAVPVATFTALQYLRNRTPQQNADYLRQIIKAEHPQFVLVQSPGELNAARVLAADTTAAPRLTLTDSTADAYVFTVGAPAAPPPPAAPPDSTGG